tara:strand:- start:722 stop:898 length:177 start_codon:yes stop_codon:yes gene_type:complete
MSEEEREEKIEALLENIWEWDRKFIVNTLEAIWAKKYCSWSDDEIEDEWQSYFGGDAS